MKTGSKFPKEARLRRRRDYARLAQNSQRYVGRLLVIEIGRQPAGFSSARLGITASRHYGRAHERNRFKRLVREAFRLERQSLSCGFELNVKPRSYAKTASMQNIRDELVRFMEKNGLLAM